MDTKQVIDNTEHTTEVTEEAKNELRVNSEDIAIILCPHCGEDCVWIEDERGVGELRWILGDAHVEDGETYEPHWCKSPPASMLEHEDDSQEGSEDEANLGTPGRL